MEPCQDDPEYTEFVRGMAKHCNCCPDCSSVPCDGVLAGGLCDESCVCEDQYYEYDENYIDDGNWY